MSYDTLPLCIQEKIDDPEIKVKKIGIPKKDLGFEGTAYWVFEEKSKFGYAIDENCEQVPCYGWCGLTTKQEIDMIFDRDWELVWED